MGFVSFVMYITDISVVFPVSATCTCSMLAKQTPTTHSKINIMPAWKDCIFSLQNEEEMNDQK
jgi:hypothetical protein